MLKIFAYLNLWRVSKISTMIIPLSTLMWWILKYKLVPIIIAADNKFCNLFIGFWGKCHVIRFKWSYPVLFGS